MNLRGWVAVNESPPWYAQPQKNEQCSPAAKMQILRSKSKKGGGVFFARRGVHFASKELFCQVEGLFLQKEREIAQKRPFLRLCTNHKNDYQHQIFDYMYMER